MQTHLDSGEQIEVIEIERRTSKITLVDGTPIVVSLVDSTFILPPTIWAKPRSGDTITVDYSLDGGDTWETPWIATTVNWDDVLAAGVSHIRFTRSAGTGTTSTVGII